MNPNEYKQTLKTPPNKSAIKKVIEKYQQPQVKQPALFDEPVVRGYKSPWEM